MDNAQLPLVSVIVPAYNSEAWIGECLDSVLAQTYLNWECVVVDDGSTDGTYAIAEGYAKQDSRFKCLRQENQGPSVARNTAVAHSQGDYVLPLDADDMIAPFYIEKAVSRMEERPDTTLVYGNVQVVGYENYLWQLPEYNYEDFIWGNTIIICSALFRRAEFDRCGGYDPAMRHGYEDWDFWLTLLNRDSVVYRIDEEVYFYRQHADSRSTYVDQNQQELLKQIYRKHEDIYSPFADQILYFGKEMRALQSRNKVLELEVARLRETRAYRIGKTLTGLFGWMKRK